ncbi:MAG: fibronectin type III domain-containing protein [Vicinamibacterales bacterium]
MRILTLVAAVVACAQPAAAQSTFLYFTSQAGDYIGQGQVLTLTPAKATFAAEENFDAGVSVDVDTTAGVNWHAEFSAPGDVPLTPGDYPDAGRYPLNGPAEPGLAIYGDGRGCNASTGRFTVLEVVYGAGGAVTRFAADFEQHCEGAQPGLFGSVRVNSTLPVPVTVAPTALSVGPGSTTSVVRITGVPTFPWTASSGAPWLSVPAGGTGDTLVVAVDRNPTTSPRSGAIVIGGATVIVTQRANGVPGEPTDLGAATERGTLHVAWQAPGAGGDATSYRLEGGMDATALAAAIDLPSGATSADFPGVPPGRYFLRVVGRNEFGDGPPSKPIALDMTSGTSLPGRPRIASAGVANGIFSMTWDPPSPAGEIGGYLLETGTVAGVMNLGTYHLAPTSSLTTRMVFGGTYFLRLRAVNSAGIGPPSAEVMIRAGNYPAPPPAPLGLAWSRSGSDVTLSWTPPTTLPGEGAQQYRLEVGVEPGATNAWVSTSGTTTGFTFPGVPPGRYYVRVRGENRRGRSAPSNEVTVVVP